MPNPLYSLIKVIPMKTLKKFLLFIIIVSTANAQDITKTLSSTNFENGYPSELSTLVQQYGMDNLKYANLETGLDSIEVFFGIEHHKNNKTYWAALCKDGILKTLKANFNLENLDSTNILTKIIELEYGETLIIKLLVQLDPTQNKVFYSWIDKNKQSRTASFQKIDKPIKIGKKMPDFSVKTLDGKTITLGELKGNYVIINWWATSCGPCYAEIPLLNQVVKKFKKNHNVKFLAIARNKASEVISFLEEQPFNYQQTIYSEDLIPIFGNAYPRHVIINTDGYVVFYKKGYNPNIAVMICDVLYQMIK
ncbi:MAG: redoxin domain-containing protein [Caldithrix sp.]|nr:redoxin domain-containing protein [Caldithrix sp.]